VWATLPDYIDTTDLLARALSENVAFVPGASAYLDGRGRSSLRLNFSGVTDDLIREGVRRIGKVVREQIGLYGTLTGARVLAEEDVASDSAREQADTGAAGARPEAAAELADVLQLPRREPGSGRTAGRHKDR
jgi:2-aminoadipate transaminase